MAEPVVLSATGCAVASALASSCSNLASARLNRSSLSIVLLICLSKALAFSRKSNVRSSCGTLLSSHILKANPQLRPKLCRSSRAAMTTSQWLPGYLTLFDRFLAGTMPSLMLSTACSISSRYFKAKSVDSWTSLYWRI